MNIVNALLSENENFKFVEVMFESSLKTYTYKTLEPIKKGDNVIVDSPRSGLTVVQVVGVKEFHEVSHEVPFQYKWIVSKVNTDAYKKAAALEMEILAEINKAEAKRKVASVQTQLEYAIGSEKLKEIKGLIRL